MKLLSLMTLFIIFCLSGCGSSSIPTYSNSSTLNIQTYPRCLSGDCVNGVGHYQTSSDSGYQGKFLNEFFHGYGKYTYPAGAGYYTGNFVKGIRQGEGVYTFLDGTEYHGTWNQNNLNGDCRQWTSRRTWENGICKTNGKVLSFEKYPETKPVITEYKKPANKPTDAELKEKANAILERIKNRKY